MTGIPVAAGELVGIDYLNEVARGHYRTLTKAVNTTTTATDLLSGSGGPVTLGANVLGSTSVVRLTAHGDWVNTSGGVANIPRFQLVLGGTTILDTNTPGTIASSATRYGWAIEAVIQEAGTTSSQTCFIRGTLATGSTAGLGAAFTTGEGSYGMGEGGGQNVPAHLIGWASGAKDGTGTLTLVLNVINGSASASYETICKGSLLEVI